MPKTFPILLEVEEIALGTVLRKLNEMPGIVKLDLNLGHGGEGPGKKQLVKAAANNGESGEQAVVKLLANGEMHIREIARQIGGSKARAYGATHQLRKKGITEPGVGKGTHRLTKKAMAQLGRAVPALPAPALTKGPGGRPTPGSGAIVLRTALQAGPLTPADLRTKLGESGVSPKSLSGVLLRAKRDGLIKKNGSGYELTAKGQKIETGASANG